MELPEEAIVETISVIASCTIQRVYPPANVSARWTYPSGDTNGKDPDTTPNSDGSYKVTYHTELTFTSDDHNASLTCHSVWDGNDDYARDSTTLQVECE